MGVHGGASPLSWGGIPLVMGWCPPGHGGAWGASPPVMGGHPPGHGGAWGGHGGGGHPLGHGGAAGDIPPVMGGEAGDAARDGAFVMGMQQGMMVSSWGCSRG